MLKESPLKCVILDMSGKHNCSREKNNTYFRNKPDKSILFPRSKPNKSIYNQFSLYLITRYEILHAAVPNIDTSGIEALSELKRTLDKRSLEVTNSVFSAITILNLIISESFWNSFANSESLNKKCSLFQPILLEQWHRSCVSQGPGNFLAQIASL